MAETAIAVALAVFQGVATYYGINRNYRNDEVPVSLNDAQVWLTRMKATLKKLENQIDEGIEDVEIYAEQVQGVAFAIEDALDKFLLDLLYRGYTFEKAIRKLFSTNTFEEASRKLSSTMNYIMNKKLKTLEDIPQPRARARPRTWSNRVFSEGDELVDFETHEVKLIQELSTTDQSRPLVIFVVGPGGSGKSSLVQKVHRVIEGEDTKSGHHWVEVEKTMRELEAGCEQTGEAEKLSVLLQQKKFPVVLDDVWRKDDLTKIYNHALPKPTPRSTAIITSRDSRVTSWLSGKGHRERQGHKTCLHDLSSGLSPEKGKELLCKMAFQGNWPVDDVQLQYWAHQILKKCEGMPLAISEIGNFLSERKIACQWKTLHDSLVSELWRDGSDLSVIRSNLQRSYRDLPSHLKSCFLYFSMFPEGYNISRERLLRLWVAEKFVIPEVGNTDEQVAEQYLIDLVERNLVVAFRDSDGKRVRSCRVLELVRQINSSRRKSFITVLEPGYKPSDAKIIRRLSAHKGGLDLLLNSMTGISGCIRTLLQLSPVGNPRLLHSQLEKVLQTNEYLKILDLEGTPNLEKFPKHVVKLRLLHYLSLRNTEVQSVPEDIKNLQLLETLDLKHTKVTELPSGIFKLYKLRHLLVNSSSEDGPPKPQGVKISEAVKKLTAIHKLSLIKVNNKKILAALKELKELRKLGLVDLDTIYGKELCTALEQMENLSTLDVRAKDLQYLDLDHMEGRSPPLYLQHLYLRGRLQELPKWISQLTSLQKLGLSYSKLNANPLEVLQALPHLIELNLLDYYTGEELVFRAGTFKKLMILTVQRFEKLESLEVEDKAMPNLKKLTICGCSVLTRMSMPDELNAVLKLENNRILS